MSSIKTMLFCLLFAVSASAQDATFTGEVMDKQSYPILQEQFYQYQIFQVNTAAIDQFVSSSGEDFSLTLNLGNTYRWQLDLAPKDIRSKDYYLTVATEAGTEKLPRRSNMTYRGFLEGQSGGKVGLTINDHLFAGTIREGDELYFIEPLSFLVKGAPSDLIVVYKNSQVIPDNGHTCGADELKEKAPTFDNSHEGHDHDANGGARVGECYEVELAIASDWLMFQDYGQNTALVEDHNITVMNNVATNWDDEFDDEMVFTIVTQFVSTCNTCDPWTANTNAGTLLGSFRSWGNGGGFGVNFDLGQLWTDRNLAGSTIGVAYLNGVCNSNNYHVLQDFTTNQGLLRVLTAHEIGHNFSAGHDGQGTPFIMAPAVNGATNWSPASQNSINNYIAFKAGQGCFSNCPSADPPTPLFSANPTQGCAPLTVQFTDQSTGMIESWFWSFPGGTPATSTQQNPIITYNGGGIFDATLTVTNSAGSQSLTIPAYIIPSDGPATSFTHELLDGFVYFTNTTSGGSTYFWDFGDGNSSAQNNPVHQYADDGTYIVTLFATNACGTTSIEQTVVVATAPQPNFTADVTEGCAPLTVQFQDLSTSNSEFWIWTFPGGTPTTSSEQNPTVVYDTPGVFPVTLQVVNFTGSNSVTINSFITVNPLPTPDFTTSIDGNTVTFTNTSINGTSYAWDFGDGNSSTEENPVHTYATGGDYVVSLTVFSDCEPQVLNENIEINAAPTAGFSANITEGCTPLTIQFSDASSSNSTSWNWSFPGGNPSSSTEQNPSVIYENAGTFNVSLTVSNAAGEDMLVETDYIVVNTTPSVGFTSAISGLDANFTNTSTNATSYAWDFGDSNSSTETSPSHSYVADGTYEVVLTATNECGDVTSSETVTIVTLPSAGFSADGTMGCTPFTVEFTSNASANTTTWNWSFPGGNPSSSSEQNPTVVYENTGTFNVSLTVSNAAGEDTALENAYIVVNTTPSTGFTSSTNNLTTTFTNTSSNATSYAWDFGDSNTSSETNPTHTYATDGTYTVTLTATNECGATTSTETITVTSLPSAGFSADATTGCAPLTIQFTSNASANTTIWNWSFPGGNPSSSSEQNPTVVYENAGTFNVSLTASNAAGEDTALENNYIVVNTTPSAGFSSSINNSTVDFTNTSTNATSYSWDFGDSNTSTATNPMHTYGADGTYTVILTATNECGSVTSSQTVNIGTLPTASFGTDVTNGCAPLTVQFSNQSSANASTYAWTFEGGNPATSSEQNPTVTFANSGTFNVSLTVSNTSGSNTATQTDYIVVNDVPSAGFNSSISGTAANFTNTSTNATSYAWNFGDGNTSTETSPNHNYSEDGSYVVTLTATNECGSVMTTETIVVVTAPTAGFSASGTSGCAPLTVQYTSTASANATTWSWSFPGGNPSSSSEQNPTVVYENAGTFNVSLTVSNTAGEDTALSNDFITINTTPNAAFSTSVSGNNANFTNNSNNADTYSWNFGDGNMSTESNPAHTYGADGTYTVVLTATNACGSVTTSEEVVIGTLPTAGFNSDVMSGCATLTVQFNNQSSANASTYAWTFEGGNPATSSEQNPVVTFANSGTFNVTLTVSNATGSNTSTQNDYIVVNEVPSAAFNTSVDEATATFTNTSSNANTYAWDFGDGNTSSENNPTHTYGSDGSYVVTLSASNECGTVMTTETVVIVTAPTAAFSANNTSGCAPLSIQFNDASSANATSWNWTFAGGTPATSNLQNPSITYANSGSYTVVLQVSNAAGTNTVTETNYVTVNDTPNAGFSISGAGSVASFTNTSTNASTYAWNFGDGNTSTESDPMHTYTTDGDYTITLSATNACGTVTTSQVFTAVTVPIAGFNADITEGCASLTVQFSDASSSNATTWNWTFPGGNPSSSTEANPTVVYPNAGLYAVTLQVSNAAGTNTATQSNYVQVNTTPNAGFTGQTIGTSINFTNLSADATSYLWDFGDGETSEDTNPTHEYNMDGTYTVTLTAINACGETSITETFEVVTSPLAGFDADLTSGCASLTVQFSDQSSDNTTGWNWTFPGGNPSSSTLQNPVVIYETPGAYNVSLVANTSAGSNTYTQSQFIQVLAPPTASFSSTINGSTANFLNGSLGASSYLWDFGDGNTSTAPNPEHSYSADGTYPVTLTAMNDCGTVMLEQTITIVSAPSAAFFADVTLGCGPLAVQFSDLSTGTVDTWQWTFSGGNPATSTEATPQVNYDVPGVYTVSLEVSNTGGSDVSVVAGYIIVESNPVAAFSPTVTGATAIFNNQSIGATTFSWDLGDGTMSTEESPFHIYEEDGFYTVTLTASNSCGTVTTSQEINVVTPPNAFFSVASTEGCAPITMEFINQSSNNASGFNWTFEGGEPATSSAENPSVTYNTSGTYNVRLIVNNAAGVDTLEELAYIMINEAPSADFTSMTDGTIVNFTNNSNNATAYTWNFGDNTSSTETDPSHEYSEPGDYTVTLTAMNECGNTTTTQMISIVGVAPQAAFSGTPLTGCSPHSVTFSDVSTGNPTSWSWTFPGGNPANSTAESPVVVYDTPGSYEVSLMVTNAFGNNTLTESSYVVINTVPATDFNYNITNGGMNYTFTNTTTNSNGTYAWDFGDGNTSDLESPMHAYENSGEYTVTLTATNECGSFTSEQTIQVVITSLEEIGGVRLFQVFPNPNSGQFTLLLEGVVIDPIELNLYNVLGQSLYQETLAWRNGRVERHFDFQELAAGTYILQLRSGSKVLYKKVVME